MYETDNDLFPQEPELDGSSKIATPEREEDALRDTFVKGSGHIALYDDSVSESIDYRNDEPLMTKEAYVLQSLVNLANTSRTANGVVDVSASSTKAASMIEGVQGDEAAVIARNNYQEAIGDLYEEKDRDFASPRELQLMIEDTAEQINGGIVKEGQLYRSGKDSEKHSYTRIRDLESAMEQFSNEFYDRLQSPDVDPVELAGWVEYRIDRTDHFFADGCGKTAKAINTWVLMRYGHALPHYRGREELYADSAASIFGDDAEQDASNYNTWQAYYKTLF